MKKNDTSNCEEIEALEWNMGSAVVTWKWRGEEKKKRYEHRLNKVLLLNDKVSLVIIASTKDEGVENAAIYNGDGSLKNRLKIPFNEPKFNGFFDIYYDSENKKLNLILSTHSESYPYNTACTLNHKTGEMSNFRKEK